MAANDSNPVHDALHGAFECAPDWTHQVLGYRLCGLTVWHLRALHFIRHPLAYSAPEGRLAGHGFEALYFAAQVCRMRPGGRIGDQLRARAEGGMGARRAAAAYAMFQADGDGQMAAFSAYWDDYFSIPLFGKRKDSKPMRSVSWLVLHTELRMRLGMGEDEAWRRHPGRAVWEITCARELAGSEPAMQTEEDVSALREAGWRI